MKRRNVLPLSFVLFLIPAVVPVVVSAKCPNGKFLKNGHCMPCPVGTYSNTEENKTSCVPCRAGRYNRFTGASDSRQCIECPYDTYSSEGATECKPCPTGTFARKGYSQCLTCTAGKFLPDYDPYNGKCSNCPSAFYRPAGTPPHNCLLCPSGMGSQGGATKCFKCPKGTHRDIQFISLKAFRGCRVCPKNQFADDEGSVQCKLCPLGSIAQNKGAKKCISCPPGTFRARITQGKCRPCPKGTTSKGMMPAGCKHPTKGCPVNTFKDNYGECRACMPGERLNRRRKKCVPCGDNQVSLGGIATECKTCPPGQRPANSNTIFERSRCECLEGTVTDGAGGCKKCPKGTRWNNRPAGAIWFTNKREDYYREASCRLCEKGFFGDKEGLSECKVCPVGTYSNIEGSTRCLRCPKGFMSRPGNPLDSESFEDIDAARDDCIAERSGCLLGANPNKRDKDGECLLGTCPPNTFLKGRFCDTCGYNQFYDPKKGCKNCPRGSTTRGRGTFRSCTICPKGAEPSYDGFCECRDSFGDDDKGGCEKCPEGEVSEYGKCAPCREGSFYKLTKYGAVCGECLENEIAKEGDRRCTKCPRGFRKEKDVFGQEVNRCVPKDLYPIFHYK